MGQRTQLFVTAETDPTAFGGARRHRIGRHHHWRYGPNMVICAAQVVEHLNTSGTGTRCQTTAEAAEGVAAIYGVNRATAETSGLSLYDDVSTATATECDNNNGDFLVNLTPEGYTIGFLIGSEQDGDLATVTGVDGLMEAFGTCWSPMPYDMEREDREWDVTVSQAVETLRAAETAGHLMDQDTADRVTAVEVPGVKTETVWDTIPRVMPDAAPRRGHPGADRPRLTCPLPGPMRAPQARGGPPQGVSGHRPALTVKASSAGRAPPSPRPGSPFLDQTVPNRTTICISVEVDLKICSMAYITLGDDVLKILATTFRT